MWLDVVGTKRTYDAIINGNVIHGYIQTLVREPVIIHMFSEEQILLLKHFDLTKISLHLDATGSVVRKIDKQQKAFLYYALTIRHQNTKTSALPLTKMLSSDHTNIEISHFLNKWLYYVKSVIHKNFAPNHVEIDFSWAMIHSICQSFNHENLESYLIVCWEMYQSSSSVIYSRTVIHICSAHIMHRFSHKLNYTLRADMKQKEEYYL